MFRGCYETTLDLKGRTSLPARFRDALAAPDKKNLFVTAGLDSCLVAYTDSNWKKLEQRLAELPSFDESVVLISRHYISKSQDCSIDSHGRILLPPLLREYAGISRDIVWAGMVSYIELWDAARWREASLTSMKPRPEVSELRKALAQFGL